MSVYGWADLEDILNLFKESYRQDWLSLDDLHKMLLDDRNRSIYFKRTNEFMTLRDHIKNREYKEMQKKSA